MNNRRKVLLYVFFFVILFFSYLNVFNIVDQNWYDIWQADSEWLVRQRIYDTLNFGFKHNAGLLGEWVPYEEIGIYNPDHAAYTAQVGFQGFFFGLLYKIIPGMNETVSYAITVSILVVCLLVILYWLDRECGTLVSLVTCIVLVFNQWLIVSARNMYWVMATFFLPIVIMLILLWKRNKDNHISLISLFIGAFFAILIRAACGYEFISLVMINLELPLIYYGIKERWNKKEFVLRFIIVAIAALLAFFSAMLICSLQVYFYSGFDLDVVINSLLGRIAYRTGAFGNLSTQDGIILDSLMASKLSIIKMYLTEGMPLIGNLRMDILIVIIAIGSMLAFVSEGISPTMGRYRNTVIALVAVTWTSLLGPLSWFVLASGHAYVHTHICYVVWSCPFLILGTAVTAFTIKVIAKDITKLLGKYISIFIVGIVCAVVFYLYNNHSSYGHRLMEYIRNSGNLIYENENVEIWYKDNQLYYYVDADEAETRFFLHVYSDELADTQIEFINKDFNIRDYEVVTPIWSSKRLSVINLDVGVDIKKIATGQFDSEKRLWETEIEDMQFIVPPRVIDISMLTDDNWLLGVNRKDNCFLVYSDDLAIYELEGKKVVFANGLEAKVINVLRESPHYWVYTEENIIGADLQGKGYVEN